MVVSINRGPQYGPPNTIVLTIGTPKMAPLIVGNPHVVKMENKMETTKVYVYIGNFGKMEKWKLLKYIGVILAK